MSAESPPGLLALRDRAYAFAAERGPVSEETLLAHVYGGAPPPALRAQLAAPLLDDGRLERRPDGDWAAIDRRLVTRDVDLADLSLTTLALAATGPSPERGRIVQLCALHFSGRTAVERFTVTLKPDRRVPGYVADRLGLLPEHLDDAPPFASILGALVAFLGTRPIFAQEARLTWAFVSAEARRAGRALAEPLLLDANQLATRVLDLQRKPTLALIASQLGIGSLRVTRPDEEARVLGLLAAPLLAAATAHGVADLDQLLVVAPTTAEREGGVDRATTLRRGQTARSQPDAPGVYVLRDAEQAPLYVGKARRLRSRLEAYAHRPLGITRRLEGLVGSVQVVDSTICATDLEALVLEDREIRRLLPRYNTVRRQRAPRLWIRLPPATLATSGKRRPAARRLEASAGPDAGYGGDFVGPFRNETLAEQARLLARSVFELDALRQGDQAAYEDQLQLAWGFLSGGTSSDVAEAHARRRSRQLLQDVLAFDLAAQLLPADPHASRYTVLRPGSDAIEGFLLDRGIFQAWSVLQDGDASRLAAELLAEGEPRTGPDDSAVVLRWFGAQRPPALLVHLPYGRSENTLEQADAIESAVLSLVELLPQT